MHSARQRACNSICFQYVLQAAPDITFYMGHLLMVQTLSRAVSVGNERERDRSMSAIRKQMYNISELLFSLPSFHIDGVSYACQLSHPRAL